MSADFLTSGSSTLSGTSMASPHVAGAAAKVLETSPAAAPSQVMQTLIGNATEGRVNNPNGSPNRLLFSD